jgi:hypothetical protein
MAWAPAAASASVCATTSDTSWRPKAWAIVSAKGSGPPGPRVPRLGGGGQIVVAGGRGVGAALERAALDAALESGVGGHAGEVGGGRLTSAPGLVDQIGLPLRHSLNVPWDGRKRQGSRGADEVPELDRPGGSEAGTETEAETETETEAEAEAETETEAEAETETEARPRPTPTPNPNPNPNPRPEPETETPNPNPRPRPIDVTG